MLTVRYIEKLWIANKFEKLLSELLAPRVESLAVTEFAKGPCAPAAALALIRLDELNQAHALLCGKLIRALISLQERDGGWGDVATTALAVRALSLRTGRGEVINQGVQYLARLQQPDGLWPRIPSPRMPEDAMVSAFALFQVADNRLFRQAVRFDEAIARFEADAGRGNLEIPTKRLWDHARLRSQTVYTTPVGAVSSWS